ncbi:MAG: glutathione S-transferase family protein [Rhodospirillales bacterium]|nr:glutathione S-transferase family protein [Rhodospirillales bacterium]MSP79773.1 glutathione S-transferase family protein [Rhodospirillales bacterium]
MILIGRYRSPFVRRVAATLKLYGIPYERRVLSTITDGDAIRAVNPLGRVPALILDSGETLIESVAILDYLDETAGPARALVPPRGAGRREVLQRVAMTIGAVEKAVALAYEIQRRPKQLIYPEWAEKLQGQARAGLAEIDRALGPDKQWLALGRLTQADVSAVATWDFLGNMLAGTFAPAEFPRLAALSERANRLPAFAETHPSLDT